MSESIFELSRTSVSRDDHSIADRPTDGGPAITAPRPAGAEQEEDPAAVQHDPSSALAEATEQAVLSLRDAARPPERTEESTPPDREPSAPASVPAERERPGEEARTRGDGGPAAPGPDELELDIDVGTVLSGRLEIVADLGGGPLGRVFKAVDRKKGTTVAVKAIPAARLPAEALAGRFAETIQLLKGLSHPNLVKVHGAGREGATAFAIMQYLEGLPLRALLDVKKENHATFGFEEAEPIIGQICQGLQFAHTAYGGEKVLVHGALKPENVFVQVDSLKIIDLGISRLFPPAEWRSLQAAGNGAPYVAPEYARAGVRIDARADVYSVGAILHEMLTGRAPAGPDAPAVSTLNPSVPRAVDRVVSKAMAARPEDRYASVAELKDAVFRVLGGDILADDLESPEEHGETFADVQEDQGEEAGIEIEYVDPDGDQRDADDLTPVGAIELQRPLWEPDEIAEQRSVSRPSGRRSGEPRPPEPPALPASAQPEPEPVPEPRSPGAPPAFHPEVEDLGARSATATEPDPPSPDVPAPEQGEPSALQSADHHSIDLELDGSEDATVAGVEPTAAVADNLQGPEPSWLDRVAAPDPRSRDSHQAPPHEAAPAIARPQPIGSTEPVEVRRRGTEISFAGAEGTPLELDVEGDPAAPSAPAPRRPTPTPAPWDTTRVPADRIPALDRAADAPAPGDRPTADAPMRGGSGDAPTAERPTLVKPSTTRGADPDDNPSARALSPPSPPPLGLDGPSREIEPAFRRTGTGTGPMPVFDPPTSAPRPTFIARRRRSRAPLFFVFALLAGAAGFGGWWAWSEGKLAFLPIPQAVSCPDGMIAFASGRYVHGSDKLDPDRDVFESTPREVQTAAFCVDRYEFPNREGERPASGLDYEAASKACADAGKRLCTEHEWERACKGGANARFPFGDEFRAGICNVGADGGEGAAAPSGSFQACGAPDGPRDLSGNVWELTSTPWPEDASARVIKGGSARVPAWGARCAYRDYTGTSEVADDVGFRCCRDAG